jgi:hypothetical protein
MKNPIIGQEAICGDGLGRVIAFKNEAPEKWIQVKTYINNRSCKWDWLNVKLINPNSREKRKKENGKETNQTTNP